MPEPPSTEVIALVVFTFVPSELPVTLTLNVHEALGANVAPARVTLPDPATAVIVPPPQLPVNPFGVETTRPAGNVSVKPTPVKGLPLGLVMVKLSVVEPLSGIVPPKAFENVGAAMAATVTLAEAVPPLPPSTDVTAVVVLFFTPDVAPVTLTLKLHEALAASDAAASVMVPDPATAVIVPPPQVPAKPLGVETTSPAGKVSVKPTPVKVVAVLGLASVKVSEVVAPFAMLAAPNALAIVGRDRSHGNAGRSRTRCHLRLTSPP